MSQLGTLSPYELLFAIQIPGLVAFVLHKLGHGRVEDYEGLVGLVLMSVSMPVAFLSGFGMIAAIVWSVFALPFWKVAGVVFLCQAVGGAFVWYLLGEARVDGWEGAIHKVSIPLVFVLRLFSSVAVVLLLWQLWHGRTT
jgi:hypothetical protein